MVTGLIPRVPERSLPAEAKAGVTCDVCHTISELEGIEAELQELNYTISRLERQIAEFDDQVEQLRANAQEVVVEAYTNSGTGLVTAAFTAGSIQDLLTSQTLIGQATDRDLANVVAMGTETASEDRDFTVNVDVTGLSAGVQTGCDPATNQYTQEVTVIYDNEPDAEAIAEITLLCAEQVRRFRPARVSVADEAGAEELRNQIGPSNVQIGVGEEGLEAERGGPPDLKPRQTAPAPTRPAPCRGAPAPTAPSFACRPRSPRRRPTTTAPRPSISISAKELDSVRLTWVHDPAPSPRPTYNPVVPSVP